MSGKFMRGVIWFGGIFAAICLVLGIASGLWGYYALNHDSPTQLGNLGNFGSFLQGTSATFCALAAAFVVLMAFVVQMRQLDVQRDELEITRNEIKEAKDRQIVEDRENERRRFEERFFQLLNLHSQNVAEMRDVENDPRLSATAQEARGRACFERWWKRFNGHLTNAMMTVDGKAGLVLRPVQKSLQQLYLSFYNDYQGELGHYFRTLYHTIKFVKDTNIGDKRRYTTLVRAQLSQYELAFLYFDGLTPIPPEITNKFKPLIEEFGLLENFNKDLLPKPMPQSSMMYSESAFV